MYDKIVTLMGGFHTIMVSLKILGKKFACLGFRDWWIDAGIIAEGSVDKAMDVRHYHRSRGGRVQRKSEGGPVVIGALINFQKFVTREPTTRLLYTIISDLNY